MFPSSSRLRELAQRARKLFANSSRQTGERRHGVVSARKSIRTRFPAVLLIVGSLAAVMGVTAAPPAIAAISIGLTNVPVRVMPANSAGSQCLDVTSGGTVAGASLQQYACQTRTQYNQVFSINPQGSTGYYSISVQSSEGISDGAGGAAAPLCLEVPIAPRPNGNGVVVGACALKDSATQQLWRFDSDGTGWTIKNVRNADRCLDVRGGTGATQSGALIQINHCTGGSNQRFAITEQSYPKAGLVYQSWFDYGPVRKGCDGQGWADGPFQTPRGSAAVQSLSTNVPTCYSSADPQAARIHAELFEEMGASFILIDDTNLSKLNPPSENGIYQASKQIVAGMSSQEPRIKSAYVLSLTCWQLQCYQDPANNQAWEGKEMAIWNETAALAEVEDIAARYEQNPSQFETIDGKPLVVFYVNQGDNVFCPRVPPASLQAVGLCQESGYTELTQAFHGPGNYIPTMSEFNPPLTVGGVEKRLNDVFSVRFGVVAATPTNWGDYDSRIWPWICHATCTGAEAGNTSIAFSGTQRSWSQAEASLDLSLNASEESATYMVINAWNEFSSTDEYSNHAYTIEPNTFSHTVPGDEAAGDPWYYYNKYKSYLAKWR